jgi:hypothetical protein
MQYFTIHFSIDCCLHLQGTSKMFIALYKAMWCNIPEDGNFTVTSMRISSLPSLLWFEVQMSLAPVENHIQIPNGTKGLCNSVHHMLLATSH